MRTLVIQGDWLLRRSHYSNLKISVYDGMERSYLGGVVGFMDKLRQTLTSHITDKVVVVWDGAFDGWDKYVQHPSIRAKKEPAWNRRYKAAHAHHSQLSSKEEHELHILKQRSLLQSILTALNVRQIEEERSESSDAIALYVNEAITVGEDVLLLCREHEFFQLLGERVSILLHDDRIITAASFPAAYGYDPTNDLMLRCFIGMPHAGISGEPGLSLHHMLHFFHGLKLEHYPYASLISYARKRRLEPRAPKTYDTVLGASDIVRRNSKLINLKSPIFNSELEQEKNFCLYSPLETSDGERAVELFEKHGLRSVIQEDPRAYFLPFQRIRLKEGEYALFHEEITI